ncbi:MAG: FecR family protein [Candidatus Obscuribacterales bacterium]|nr:FecR family protein [Candidatus Obscuribacterales bacterium]
MKNLGKSLITTLSIISIFSLSADARPKSDGHATLSESHGTVMKRGFLDWKKELWEDPSPAKRGDKLDEGMQVATGDKSWAQISWPYVTSRAWSNSVYAIAPNQRLAYLVGGEVLYQLDKKRKDKSEYVIWTKLVQARLRGTTVLVQASPGKTKITVLEGVVDAMNRTDRSVVRLTPGVVYEVSEPEHLSTAQALVENVKAEAVSRSSGSNSAGKAASHSDAQNNIAMPGLAPVALFETRQTSTVLSLVDPNALLAHPLLSVFNELLPSISLVKNVLSSLNSDLLKITKLEDQLLPKVLSEKVKIVSVPRLLSYKLGPAVVSNFTMPPLAYLDFPASGVIGQALNQPAPSVMGAVVPTGALAGSLQANVALQGVLPGGALPINTGSLNLSSTTSSLVSGSASSVISPATGAVGAVLGGVTGGAGALLGGAGTTVGSATGTIGSSAGGLVYGTTTTLGGVTQTVTQTGGGILGGLTGGLGSLLGH